MTERLAIPAWSVPPRTLDAWAEAFVGRGHAATIEGATSEEAELVVESLGLRAFASLEAGQAVALDFDIDDDAPAEALAELEAVARGLRWELHDESGED